MSSKLIPQYQDGSILSAVGEVVITLDKNLQIQWANQKAGELANDAPENLVGQYCYQVLRGPLPTCEDCPVEMTIQTGETQEKEREASDGRYHNVRSYPLYSREGVLDGVALLGLDITDRKRMEEAHRISAEKYRNLAENTRDILFSVDAEGVIQYVGPQVKQYGFEREDLEGQLFLDIVFPGDREHVYANFLQTIEEGLMFFSEFRIPMPDGQTYWFEEISDIERYDTGTIRRITGILRDITERKQAEEALRLSENYYRAIFETSGTAMFILEEDTTISHVNSNFEELTGYTKQQIEGKKSWTEITHPDDVAWIKKNNYLRRQHPDDALRQYEFRYFTCHGEKRNLLLTVDKIPGTKRMIASGIDITERKQVDEALRESEERYRRLINTSPDAIALVDEHGRFLTVNPAMAQRFDLSPEELEGKTYYDLMPKDLADKRITDAKKSLDYEESVCVEDERRDSYLQNYYVPLPTSENRRTCQIISRDITEQKKAEEKFRTLFESANDAIFLMQEDQFIECNAKTLELFDCTREQILGKPPYLFSPELQPDGRYSRDKAIEKINSCLQGEPQFFEWRHCRYDGTPFETNVSLNQVKLGQDDFIQAIVRDITERKQAEAALRESEKRFRSILEKIPGGIFAHDLNGRIILVNEQACINTRYTREELLDMTVWDIDPYALTREDQTNLWQGLEIGEFTTIESIHIKKDGTQYPTEIHLSAITLDEQFIILPIAFDVSRRKQVEQALRESEQQFKTLFTESPVSITVHDKDNGEIIDANPKACASYGLSSVEEIKARGIWMEPPYSHAEALGWIIKAATEGPQQFEWLSRNIFGELFWEQVRLIPITINGVERVVATAVDITELKETEDELRKREEHLQAILKATPDPLVVYNKQGHPQYINPSFSQVFGWTFEELQGERIPFVPEDQKEPTFTKIQEIYSTGIPVTFDTKRLTKDNRLLDIRVSAAIIQSPLQGHYGLVVILTDITERKQMEEKLKEMSLHDSLTGLYSRNFFEEEMTRLSDGRYNPLGIIICDVDGLKFINDTLGHQFGDRVLLTTADILRQSFRSSDIIARIGGDEFAILLTETEPGMVEQTQQRLRQAVQDFNSTNPDIPISLSLGLALSEGETVDMQALFRQADNRMYREKIQHKGSTRSAVFQILTGSMQARDFDTEGHCERLQELAASLARSLDRSQDFLNNLSLLARFHDLGKVGVPDHILFKPGPLSEEEWRQMRQHSEIGHRIASLVPDLEPIADYILKHHENWDGSGYPWGLSGEDIPLLSRILAIADAYDAMTSDRPYRKAMSREEAIG